MPRVKKRKKLLWNANNHDHSTAEEKNCDWVGELEMRMNDDFHLQPVYSVVKRHHLFPSVRHDYTQVTVLYGSEERQLFKRGRDYSTTEMKAAMAACIKLKVKGAQRKNTDGSKSSECKIGDIEGWCPKCGIKKSTGNFCHLCGSKLEKTEIHKLPGVKVTPDGIPILTNMGTNALEVVHECFRYMSDDVLATLFKDLLHFISTRVKHIDYEFRTELCRQRGFVGFTSVLVYNFKNNFQSLGVMVDANQAEQSASEVCLREQGFLPNKPREEYTIQPYEGGLPYHIEGFTIDQPSAFTSNVFSDVLEAFCFTYHLRKPNYYGKKGETRRVIVPLTPSFKQEETIQCLCWIGGKSFNTPFPHTERVARQFTAHAALQHFGVARPQERMELRKYVNVNKFELKHETSEIRIFYRPSLRKGWVYPRFCKTEVYGEDGGDELISSGIVKYIIQEKKEYANNLLKAELNSAPAFRGELLSDLTDLSVANIDANNPNLFVIGNSNFSIKLLTDGGKLYCRKHKTYKKLLPGDNIRKVSCEYRISLPSLEIHVKGAECEDIYPSVPPLPVVTSCCVVLLYHDLEANPEDVYVLVTQRLSGTSFDSKVKEFVKLLRGLRGQENCESSPAACTKDIEKWLYKEVASLSEMTAASVGTLMSGFCKYDKEWDKLFTHDRLPRPLKEIQNICRDELRKRKREGLFDEEDKNAEMWELPQSEFVTSFESIGIHLEDSLFCARRALTQSTGYKIIPSSLEDCATVDITLRGDDEHIRDVTRFYMLSEVYEGKVPNTTHKQMLHKGYQKYGDLKWLQYDLSIVQYLYKPAKSIDNMDEHLLNNIYYRNADGSRTKYVDLKPHKANYCGPAGKRRRGDDEEEEDEVEDDVDAEEEDINEYEDQFEEKNESVDGPCSSEEAELAKLRREKMKRYYENKRLELQWMKRGGDPVPGRDVFRQNCVWKKLDEAVNMCPMLFRVSQTSQFVDRLKSLVDDADNYMKGQVVDKTVKCSLVTNVKVEVKVEEE